MHFRRRAEGVFLAWRGSLLVALFAAVGLAGGSAAGSPDDLEKTVCGWLLERAAFALWSSVAGRPDPTAWKSVPGAAPVAHQTRDGRTLHGYRISAHPPGSTAPPATGFMLFAQGNAMLADRLLGELTTFAEQGVDVFVYDYRGYGRSQGTPRLKAIVDDYRDLFHALGAGVPGGQKYLYGVSFGGLVLLNVIGGRASFDRAVIDSTPSRVSPRGCPEQYDPVRNLPPDASGLLVISGDRDGVVTPSEQAELRSAAASRGARVVSSESFAHPFMDRDVATHRARQRLIRTFLFGER
jgi:alpha/beta superfamily hydrolase